MVKSNNLKIGWAFRNVSTDKPINIPGQFNMRISQGISDPITTTVLVVENGNDIAVFVSLDAVAVRHNLVDEVRGKVSALNDEIPPEKIIINATHTHTGPSYYADTGWDDEKAIPDDMPYHGVELASSNEYGEFLSTEIADAIVEAFENRYDGGIAYGYGYAVVSHSRRVIYFDDTSKRDGGVVNGYMVNGHGIMYGNTKDDNFSHYEAGADHFLNIMFTFDRSDNLTGAIINVPCPSQCSEHEYTLSADYWNDVRLLMKEKFGDIHVLGQCAAAGDLSPRILHYHKAQERRFKLKYMTGAKDRNERKDIAERIVAGFSEVYEWAKNDIMYELPINHAVETLHLSKRLITDDELEFCKQQLENLNRQSYIDNKDDPIGTLDYNSSLKAQRSRYKGIIERYNTQADEPKLPMEVHAVKIGDIAFTTNSFELYMDYMHRIQARSPFTQTFVVQLTGIPGKTGGSYLATERGTENKGYSACLFCNVVSPEGGQELVNESVRLLKEIY